MEGDIVGHRAIYRGFSPEQVADFEVDGLRREIALQEATALPLIERVRWHMENSLGRSAPLRQVLADVIVELERQPS